MNSIGETKGERIFKVVNAIFLVILTLIFLIPFLVVLSTSFVSEEESAIKGAFILIPRTIDFSAYKVLLSQGSIIYRAYLVTIFRVVVGTSLNLAFTAILAYGLAKKQLPLRNVITTFVFITMLFDGGLIPTYMVVQGLGLIDSLWALIIPGLINTWNLIIMRTFFQQIPESIEESATIDGASPLQILIKIVLPLSISSLVTIGLFYAVSHWNAWFDAAIYLNDNNKMPVQMIMRNIVISMTNQDINNQVINDMQKAPPAATLKSAVIVVSTLPIVLIYPFVQKYFVKGMLVGSVKG